MIITAMVIPVLAAVGWGLYLFRKNRDQFFDWLGELIAIALSIATAAFLYQIQASDQAEKRRDELRRVLVVELQEISNDMRNAVRAYEALPVLPEDATGGARDLTVHASRYSIPLTRDPIALRLAIESSLFPDQEPRFIKTLGVWSALSSSVARFESSNPAVSDEYYFWGNLMLHHAFELDRSAKVVIKRLTSSPASD